MAASLPCAELFLLGRSSSISRGRQEENQPKLVAPSRKANRTSSFKHKNFPFPAVTITSSFCFPFSLSSFFPNTQHFPAAHPCSPLLPAPFGFSYTIVNLQFPSQARDISPSQGSCPPPCFILAPRRPSHGSGITQLSLDRRRNGSQMSRCPSDCNSRLIKTRAVPVFGADPFGFGKKKCFSDSPSPVNKGGGVFHSINSQSFPSRLMGDGATRLFLVLEPAGFPLLSFHKNCRKTIPI